MGRTGEWRVNRDSGAWEGVDGAATVNERVGLRVNVGICVMVYVVKSVNGSCEWRETPRQINASCAGDLTRRQRYVRHAVMSSSPRAISRCANRPSGVARERDFTTCNVMIMHLLSDAANVEIG